MQRLPALNACLNAAAASFLACGWVFIKRRNVPAHRACMLAAFGCSTAFLCGYLYYHARFGAVYYRGAGLARAVYLSILISHTLLAGAIVPLVLRTLFLGLGGRFETHAWWARRTIPLWIYVSVTGVVIYEMLYRF